MSRVTLALTANALVWVRGGDDALQARLVAAEATNPDEYVIGDCHGKTRLSDVFWLRANKSHSDVAICHGAPFDPATDTFTFQDDRAREAFLDSVARSGGFARTEDAYGPLRNVLAPTVAILFCLGIAVVGFLDFRARGSWSAAVAVLGVMLLIGSAGWLVEGLRKPAIVVLLRRRG
jgi:hypothetical protein